MTIFIRHCKSEDVTLKEVQSDLSIIVTEGEYEKELSLVTTLGCHRVCVYRVTTSDLGWVK